MAEYVFTEDGTPVFKPFTGRRRHGFMEPPAPTEPLRGNAFSAASKPDAPGDLAAEAKLLSHIFDIDERAFDVTLTSRKITWSIIGGQKGSKILLKKSASVPGVGRVKENRQGTGGEVLLKDLFAVTVRYHRATQSSVDGVCRGLELHTYERRLPNKIRHRLLFLAHPSHDVCNTWRERASSIVQGIAGRPRRVRVYLNPYAGEKRARQEFKDNAAELLELAGIQTDICELDKKTIKEDMSAQDLWSYDGLVAVGGDGTVNEVINQLLLCSQSANGVKVDTSFTPVPAMLPIAIFPCGTTNHICHSTMGVSEIHTATLHLIYGNRMAVDVCSISNKEDFYRFGFNSHYGFGGNVLSYLERYRHLGSKKMAAAFLKGLSKSKFRPYSVELSYVLTQSKSHPMDGIACRTGCSVCGSASTTGSDPSSECVDSLQELDPLALSSTSSTIAAEPADDMNAQDLSAEKVGSKIVKGDYLNISVLAIPGNNEMAPDGLTKYGHLGDGCADLVLIKNVKKKEFVRHLKRFNNAKNQFDFPFVEVYRVKEVRVNPRMPKGWQFRGDFNEIAYEMKRREQQQSGVSGSSVQDVVQEIGGSDSDDDDEIPAAHIVDDSSSEDDAAQPSAEEGRRTASAGSGSRCGTPSSGGDVRGRTTGGATDSKDRSPGEREPYVQMNYRALEREKVYARQKRKDEAKEKRNKEKAEMLVRSIWNVDNTAVKSEVELSFRVHRQLVSLFGQGLSPDTPSEDAKITCLPIIS